MYIGQKARRHRVQYKRRWRVQRQLWAVIRNNYPRPIESAMESNRLVSSAETCEHCHQRTKRRDDSEAASDYAKYSDDEGNTPNQTVLMVMVDKIHGAHLSPGVAIRYAAADKKRQTIPWVEYHDASGATRTYLTSDVKPDQAAAMPKFSMECVDCHNRAAHSFEMPDRAVDAAMASGQIATDLPFVKKTGLALIQAQYANEDEG